MYGRSSYGSNNTYTNYAVTIASTACSPRVFRVAYTVSINFDRLRGNGRKQIAALDCSSPPVVVRIYFIYFYACVAHTRTRGFLKRNF